MTERWLKHVAAELGVDGDIASGALLDAARVVAHSVERKATPLTTYLIGLAVGAAPPETADVDAMCRRVIEMARAWNPEEASDAERPGG